MLKTRSKLTIKKIAQIAGVSQATVSRVINNSGYISEELRERVENVIAEYRFSPDPRARGLRGKQSNIVGLLIPDILNVYYTTLAKNIENSLRENSYIMVLGLTNDKAELHMHHLNQFWEMHVDGIIYVPPPEAESPSLVRSLYLKGMPMVELNRRREDDILDGVLADNFGGINQGMHYLTSLGHKKIALISGSTATTTGERRLEGYKWAINEVGIPLNESFIKIGQFNKEYGKSATQELLEEVEKPTAIFAGNNRILMGVMNVLTKEGFRVPEDISVISFDDSEWFEITQPPITSVDVAIDKMGSLAVELILKRIKQGAEVESPTTYTLSTTLIERQSCCMIGKKSP